MADANYIPMRDNVSLHLVQLFHDYMFFFNPTSVLDSGTGVDNEFRETICQSFLSVLRIVEVCRKDRMTLQVILQREHSFQGTMTQLSSFLDEDDMATTMEFVNAFGNTAAARVREWLEEWLQRRSELPVDLEHALLVFFRSPQHGVLKGSARGNPWCHAILESRVEALNEYRIKVDPPVWQFDLPADILPRETNFVAEQITANFLRMLTSLKGHCQNYDEWRASHDIPVGYWMTVRNPLYRLAQMPGFGFHDRASITPAILKYMVDNHHYQHVPRPFGMVDYAFMMKRWYPDPKDREETERRALSLE